MRLCRIGPEATPRAAFYFDTHVVPVATAAVAHSQARGTSVRMPTQDDLVPLLGDFGMQETETWLARTPNPPGAMPIGQAELLVPVPKPNKIFCLAGNYAEHVKEGGDTPAERAETFPYVFMKPPTTTLTHPNRPVADPKGRPGRRRLGAGAGRHHRPEMQERRLKRTPTSTSPGTRSSMTSRSAATGRTRAGRNGKRTCSSTGCTASGSTPSARAGRVPFRPRPSPGPAETVA